MLKKISSAPNVVNDQWNVETKSSFSLLTILLRIKPKRSHLRSSKKKRGNSPWTLIRKRSHYIYITCALANAELCTASVKGSGLKALPFCARKGFSILHTEIGYRKLCDGRDNNKKKVPLRVKTQRSGLGSRCRWDSTYRIIFAWIIIYISSILHDVI